eukprot:TRINITY_DN3552_c0_g1_i1.p1 TRINITY_DN3552_c0_g1~~TRINITY_DN3552_c0_g1_i1.p1  ORF type:complete len:158 (-),score=40.56 TRINITY_DN3552_c0_g1_i1:179-652(-)
MIIAILMFILSFLGCCGAAIENKNMLLGYIFILIGLLIVQVAIGGATIYQKDNFEQNLETQWRTLNNNTIAWMEVRFECCGFKTSDANWNTTCGAKTPTPEPCGPKIEEYVKGKVKAIGIMSIIFSVLEVIGLLFAIIVCIGVDRKRKHERRERILG